MVSGPLNELPPVLHLQLTYPSHCQNVVTVSYCVWLPGMIVSWLGSSLVLFQVLPEVESAGMHWALCSRVTSEKWARGS